MSTSAGSLALAGVRAARDAHVAAQLRAAGAVIIGKTNLSPSGPICARRIRSAAGARAAA
jgi:Asp-tRNA(Asn)/Glu-tRNA(Gln) amidotransferase A subunit family amidase